MQQDSYEDDPAEPGGENEAGGNRDSVEERMGGRWNVLGEHLAQAAMTEDGAVTLASTLGLVKALDRDQRDLAEGIRSGLAGRPILKGAN